MSIVFSRREALPPRYPPHALLCKPEVKDEIVGAAASTYLTKRTYVAVEE